MNNPKAILETLPGVNAFNIEKIMDEVENLSELSKMSLSKLEEIMGKVSAKQLYEFFNTNADLVDQK